ncbi:TPR-containing protein DDB_G0280363-like [Lingula anatina]|uniref:TPR-containing protein DDB_G0280363-like n=1 Tax=Lingula anatina TaxID=7574 RepID=A0A1S3H218_LINAN|nr:TPR-containing protein DDB_G0280363-like [Lingula anatina]|eukprot:XP_013380063.1 TPR-containing protein DDB_G0280363-like [Lingula anatina]
MDDENGAEKDDESPVRDENYVKGQGEGQKGASGQVDVKTSNQEPAPSSGRSKFQQDIAQGIQASLNRPDLQEQKPRPEEPVQPHQDQVTPLKEPKEDGSKGDTEDVSSPCPGTPESPETVKKAPAPATAPQRVSLVRQPMMDQRPEMLRTKSFQLQEQYLKLQQLQREHALRQKDHTPTPSPPQSQQSGYSQLPQAAFVRQGSLRGHYELSPEGQPTRQAPYQDKPVQNGAFVRTGSLRGPHPQYSMPHPQGMVEAGNFNRQGSFKGHQENPSGSRGVPQLHPQQQQQYSGKQGVTPPPNPQQQPVMHQHQQQRQHSQSHVPAEKGQHSHGHSQHHHQQHHQQQHVPQHHHQQQQHHHHQSQQQKPQQHFNQGADKTPALNGEAKSHATQSQSQLPHSQPQSTASQPKSQPATQSTSHLTQSKPLPSAQSQLSRPDQNKRPPQAAPVSFGHQTTV